MAIQDFTPRDLDRIIEMAWEDRTPFEAIEFQFGLSESKVISLMRSELKGSSFRLWRKRVKNDILALRLAGKAEEATRIEKVMAAPDFWNQPDKARETEKA